ncbi:MAG: acyltransferase [Chloroflexota bacterium]|nr:acyltransferase [Chloroflexota bacterium]
MPTTFRLGHRPALDGLRGLFVLIVVAYHIGLPYSEGGYLGVDGFFVLSGFLITSLLLQERQTHGKIDLTGFYKRRALRLLPGLALFLTTMAVATILFGPPGKVLPNLRGVVAAALYISNWAMIYLPRFGIADTLGMLGHMWSLAIEEQFYLVWPVALILVLRYLTKRSILIILTTLIVCLVAWRAHLYLEFDPVAHRWESYESMRLYIGTDSRSDGLVIGALLSCFLSFGVIRPTPRLRSFTRLSLALLLPVLVFSIGYPIPRPLGYFYGGYTLLSITFALCILHIIASPSGVAARLLSLRPLVGTGKVSYGLYLWHPPIFLVFGLFLTGWANPPLQVAGLLVTVVVVLFSYYFVEMPAVRLKSRLVRAGSATNDPQDRQTQSAQRNPVPESA